MSTITDRRKDFIGYEYKDINVTRETEAMYVDAYENFGWSFEDRQTSHIGINSVNLKFKRDRKIRNKAELTRLQRQFDAYVSEITRLERSKAASASVVAYTVGIIGCAFLAGATFSYLAGSIILCVILAIPGFAGWILPYFLYNSTYAKKTEQVTPLIETKYDEIYDICERANSLLGN